MAWIQTLSPDEATGRLRQEYDQAVRRAGKIFNIVRLQSLHPEALHSGMQLYTALMLGNSGLSRAEREMIAVAVSAANHCHY